MKNDPNYIRFAKNLKIVRAVHKWSQSKLAQETGLKTGQIGAYEEARAFPPPYAIIAISRAVKMPIDDLMTAEFGKKE